MTTRTNQLQAMLLAVLLAIGAGLVWGLVAGWVMTIINNVVMRPRQVSESIAVLSDGTPIIESSARQGRPTSTTCRTLDGSQIRELPVGRRLSTLYLGGSVGAQAAFTRPSWNNRIIQFFRTQQVTEAWYAVHDGNLRGRVYMVGFDMPTKRTIGYVGKNGFRPDAPPPDDQFPVNGARFRYSSYLPDRETDDAKYMLTDDGLVLIDWDNQSVKSVCQDDNLVSMARWRVFGDDDERPVSQSVLVRSSDRVRVLDLAGNVLETFALPAELRNGNLSWTPLGDGKALAWSLGPHCELFWLDATGIVRRQKVDLQLNVDSDVKKTTLISAVVPVPVVWGAVSAVVPLESRSVSETGSYLTSLASFWAEVWPPILVVVAVAAVLAWLCYRRQRQFGLSWTPAWVVFVFLFGLPGYIGYRTHRRWPTCLPCPSCGRTAPRDRPACCHCHHDFPAPAPTGTEIFAANNSVL